MVTPPKHLSIPPSPQFQIPRKQTNTLLYNQRGFWQKHSPFMAIVEIYDKISKIWILIRLTFRSAMKVFSIKRNITLVA